MSRRRRENKRSDFRKVQLQRKIDDCNERGQRSGEWQYVRDVYVCATPKSSYERVINNAQSDATLWDVEIMFAAGLTADDRIMWQGRWLEFNGRPYTDGKRCNKLLVNATEVNCDPNELQTSKGGCGCQTS